MKKRAILKIILTAALTAFAGCGKAANYAEVGGKSYVYENDGFGGDFVITLNDDGTYSYYEGSLSSYIGYGRWEFEKDFLVLSDDEEMGYALVNRFLAEDDDLIFCSEGSDGFLYVDVADGDRFNGTDEEKNKN